MREKGRVIVSTAVYLFKCTDPLCAREEEIKYQFRAQCGLSSDGGEEVTGIWTGSLFDDKLCGDCGKRYTLERMDDRTTDLPEILESFYYQPRGKNVERIV